MTSVLYAAAPVAHWVTLEALVRDPYPVFERLRAETPVAWVPAVNRYLIAGFDDCQFVELSPHLFSAAEEGHRMNRAMGTAMLRKDDPEHAVERRAINPTLRIKAAKETWKPVFEAHARELLDDFILQGSGADLNAGFAAPFAARILTSLVGFPTERWEDVRRWSTAYIDATANTADDPEVWRRSEEANREFDALLLEILPELRRNPNQSLLSGLTQAGLPEAAVKANAKLAISGGINEPQHVLTSGVWAFDKHEEQLSDLLADHSLFTRAFNEVARWLSPVGFISRVTTRDVTLSGVSIPAGSLIGASIQSANRDATRFPRADELDIHRDDHAHFAFGAGTHMCAGRWVAETAVGDVAWPLLYSRLKGLRLAQPADVKFSGWAFRGIEELKVEWDSVHLAQDSAAFPSANEAKPESIALTVADRWNATDDVVVLELVHPDGRPLPGWLPGAHLPVRLGPGLERHYSLCGTLESTEAVYRIAVLREKGSRGGSSHIHEQLHPGGSVEVGIPANNFRFRPAERYIFVAGGIGITPILPMIQAANSAGSDWSLLYLGSTRQRMPFLHDLQQYGERVTPWPQDELGRIDLALFLGTPDSGTQVYACGPNRMLDGLEALSADWPKSTLHLERFSAKAQLPVEEHPFTVELERSGRKLAVPVGSSILDVLHDAGISAPSSCHEGVCGTCSTTVLEGLPCHRDSILDADEREANSRMMICVSRAATPSLKLDL